MKIVYAKEPRVIAYGGMRIALRPGEPWDGGDPLVEAHPDAFVDGPTTVRSTRNPSGVVAVPVEADDKPADKPRPQRRAKATRD